MRPWLFSRFLRDQGIIFSPVKEGFFMGHYKGSRYEPISRMECHKGLERCLNEVLWVPQVSCYEDVVVKN